MSSKIVEQAASLVNYFCNSLPKWEVSKYVEVLPQQSYTYELPANFSDLPAHFVCQYEQDLIIPPQRIFYLTGVFAVWQGMVFKNLRVFMPSLQTPELGQYFKGPLLLKQWYGTKIHLKQKSGVAIAHSQYAPENYYHWILDTLPRLLLLREYHPNIELIVLDQGYEFTRATMTAMGFNNIIPVSKEQVLKIDNLILPELLSPSGHVNPKLVRLVRDELVQKLGNPDVVASAIHTRRIYVSRAQQRGRRVANQEALDILLDEYGFETIHFEGLGLAEQIALMQETAVLLSVHGANLVNLIFLPPQSKVIELISQTLHNPAYWRLSAVFHLQYYVLACETTEKENISYHSNLDVIVDINALKNIFINL